jgi:hypothetical protein
MAENEKKEGLKLFVVNAFSSDPEDWRDACGNFAIVLAHDEKEAVSLSREVGSVAAEISLDRPMLIAEIRNPWPS